MNRNPPNAQGNQAAPDEQWFANLPVWNGQVLSGDRVAVALVGSEEPQNLAAAAPQEASQLVRPDDLNRFLGSHQGCRLICYDAAQLHWSLLDQLQKSGDPETIKAVWSMSSEYRLVDVMLLDQRHRLSQKLAGEPRAFEQLIGDHCVPGWRSSSCIVPEPTTDPLVIALMRQNEFLGRCENEEPVNSPEKTHGDAITPPTLIGDVCQQLHTIYANLLEEFSPFLRGRMSTFFSRYGPVGVGIDVLGAIAASARQPKLEIYWAVADQLYEDASLRLFENPDSRNCFEWNGRLVKLTVRGRPVVRKSALEKWLLAVRGSIRDSLRQELLLPKSPVNWGSFAYAHSTVSAWIVVKALAELYQAGKQPTQTLRPRYHVIPRLRLIEPNLEFLNPPSGNLVHLAKAPSSLILELVELELCCLASVCATCVGTSAIGDLKKQGRSVVAFLSEQLGNTFRDSALRNVSQQELNGIAELLLFAVPRRLPPVLIRDLLQGLLPTCSIGEALASSLALFLRKEVFPELETLLTSDTLQELSNDDARKFAMQLSRTFHSYGYWQIVLAKSPNQEAWGVQADVARKARKALRRTKAHPQSDALLVNFPWGRTGRIGKPTIGAQVRSEEYLDQADEIIMSVYYELIANGYSAAYGGRNSFAIGGVTDRDDVVSRLKYLVKTAAERVQPSFELVCDCRMVGISNDHFLAKTKLPMSAATL